MLRCWAFMALAGLPLAGHATERIQTGAAACSSCHAATVTAAGNRQIPDLAGQSAEVLTEKLLAFRAGTLEATVMTRIARGFDEAELRAIARALTSP